MDAVGVATTAAQVARSSVCARSRVAVGGCAAVWCSAVETVGPSAKPQPQRSAPRVPPPGKQQNSFPSLRVPPPLHYSTTPSAGWCSTDVQLMLDGWETLAVQSFSHTLGRFTVQWDLDDGRLSVTHKRYWCISDCSVRPSYLPPHIYPLPTSRACHCTHHVGLRTSRTLRWGCGVVAGVGSVRCGRRSPGWRSYQWQTAAECASSRHWLATSVCCPSPPSVPPCR